MNDEDVAVVGVYRYRGIAAVTYYRLMLHMDGTMELHHWRDMGGRWDLRCHGRFSVDGAEVMLKAEWPLSAHRITYPEDLSRPFHRRFVKNDLLLISDKNVLEFDQSAEVGTTDSSSTHSYRQGWAVFWKEQLPKGLICVSNEKYEHALTPGKTYVALAERVDEGLAQVRIVGNHGRTRWFPGTCFRSPLALQIPRMREPLVSE